MNSADRTAIAAVVGDIDQWKPIGDLAEKFSGASIDRVLTTDGRRFVVKRQPAEGDWLTRATDGLGRTRRLWDDGVFHKLSPEVDHAIVAVVPTSEGDAVVMRDVSDVLVPAGGEIPIRRVEQVVGGLARMHTAWEGFSDEHCSVAARLSLFAPTVHEADAAPNPHPLREKIVRGWEAFGDLVPSEITDAVARVHRAPDEVARRLKDLTPSTLLHGDAKPENLGTRQDGLVAIDWGELTGSGPAETDLAWFAVQGTWRIDALPDEIFRLYEVHAARPLDRASLDLACTGALAQMGFKLALRSIQDDDEGLRTRAETLLEWWNRRVRNALERTPLE